MFSNRYAGDCHLCGIHVPRNAGIYDYGVLYCGEPVSVCREDVSEWRIRYANGIICHDFLREQLKPEQFMPTREMAEQMFERLPSAFNSASRLEVCPRLFEFWNSDEARAEMEIEREAEREEQARIDEALHARLLAGFDELVVKSRVRSITQVITKVLGEFVEVGDMTLAQLRDVTVELHERIRKREERNNPNCSKCGGSGAYWKRGINGHAYDDGCWRCHGTGKKVSHR